MIATTATYEDIAQPRLYAPMAYRIPGISSLKLGSSFTTSPYKIAAADPSPVIVPVADPYPALSVPLEYPSFGATGGWGSGYSSTTAQGYPPAGSVSMVPMQPQPQSGSKAAGPSAPPL